MLAQQHGDAAQVASMSSTVQRRLLQAVSRSAQGAAAQQLLRHLVLPELAGQVQRRCVEEWVW
jgi:hypothetical protein